MVEAYKLNNDHLRTIRKFREFQKKNGKTTSIHNVFENRDFANKKSRSELKFREKEGIYMRDSPDHFPEKKVKLSPPKVQKPVRSI